MVREVEHRRDVRVAAAGGLVLPLSQLSELIHPSAWKDPYSISYVNRPAGHYLPGRIETRKDHKDAPNRARAPEIEPVKATQS
jgi:hypothetical protein